MNFSNCLEASSKITELSKFDKMNSSMYYINKFIQEYAEYDYDRNNLPNLGNVNAILKDSFSRNYSYNIDGVLLNILYYYKTLLNEGEDQMLTSYLNWSRGGDNFEFIEQTQTLKVSNATARYFRIGKTDYSWMNAFRVEELICDVPHQQVVWMSAFNKMEVSRIVVRGANKVRFHGEVYIPDLKYLELPKNSCTIEIVQEFVMSDFEIEVVFTE